MTRLHELLRKVKLTSFNLQNTLILEAKLKVIFFAHFHTPGSVKHM